MIGPRGNMWSMDAKTLAVPPDSRWLMDEILGSPTIPYIASSTPNTVREGLTGKVWKRLAETGNDCWFVFADKAGTPGQKGHMMTCVMRLQPQFNRDNVFVSGDRRYKGRVRVGFCNPDPRGIDGSLGG
jgi:hypothetical protein